MDSTQTVLFVAFGLMLLVAASLTSGGGSSGERVAARHSPFAESGVGIRSRDTDWMNHRAPRSLGEVRALQVEALRRQAEFARSMDRISRDSDE